MGISYTLKDIRRAVGVTTGEMMLLPATDAGSSTTFVDQVHLLDRQDNAVSLVNRVGYFSGGTPENVGHEVRITNFAKNPVPTLTFAPEVPSATQEGDELELWSNWTRFGGIPGLHQLINDGIRSVAHLAGDFVEATVSTDFDPYNPELTLPETMTWFGGADVMDLYGRWKKLSERFLRPKSVGGVKTVELRGVAVNQAYRGTVRVWGYTDASLLTLETDDTTVNFM